MKDLLFGSRIYKRDPEVVLKEIFKYKKKVLSEYIMYCINAKKGSQMECVMMTEPKD